MRRSLPNTNHGTVEPWNWKVQIVRTSSFGVQRYVPDAPVWIMDVGSPVFDIH